MTAPVLIGSSACFEFRHVIISCCAIVTLEKVALILKFRPDVVEATIATLRQPVSALGPCFFMGL